MQANDSQGYIAYGTGNFDGQVMAWVEDRRWEMGFIKPDGLHYSRLGWIRSL